MSVSSLLSALPLYAEVFNSSDSSKRAYFGSISLRIVSSTEALASLFTPVRKSLNCLLGVVGMLESRASACSFPANFSIGSTNSCAASGLAAPVFAPVIKFL